MVLKIQGQGLDINGHVIFIDDLIRETVSPDNQKTYKLGSNDTDKIKLSNLDDGLSFAGRNNKIELTLDGNPTDWKPYLKELGNHTLTVKLKAPHRGGVNELSLTADWSLPPNHGQRK